MSRHIELESRTQYLSHDEERERLHLERQVERAFYQAGLALQTLRDKRLYRSTHKTFQEYCKDRFGFAKSHSYRLINAVEIVDNISQKVPNWGQNENEFQLILPTAESQVRPLHTLKTAELQQKAWSKAVELANGIPSAKIVREVVNEIKAKETTEAIVKNNPQTKSKVEFIPLENPQIGQRVRICSNHPLFPERSGIITQLPNNRSAVVELENQQRELIKIEALEIQRIVDKNGKVTSPNEGINYVRGVGLEWYVRLDEETWNKLNQYAQQVGTATLGSAVAQLLESNKS